MHHDVCPVFDGAHQIRRSQGIVHHQRQPVAVRQLCQRGQVGHIAVRVAQGLHIDGTGFRAYGCFHLIQAADIHKICRDTIGRQRMSQQVIAAAIDGALGNNMTAVLRQRLQGIAHCCRTRCQSQRRHAAFQSRHSLFQHILGRIRQAAVDIAHIAQGKPVCRMLAIAEYIRSGGIHRHGACPRGRVGTLLPCMQL